MTIQKLRRSVFVPIALIALLFGMRIADAQTGNAVVAGIVTDSTGALVPNASVVLTNPASGNQLTVTTGADGRYLFPTVAPGTYTLTVTAPTFSVKSVTGLTLQLDQHLNLPVSLAPGSETTTVNVTGEVPQVDTTAYDTGGVVAQTQFQDLPIQSRSYLNMAVLVPGTTQAVNASRTFYNTEVSGGGGAYFYASGFYLDGVTNQQTEEGDPRQNIPMGAVAEFKVFTSSMPIELGWAMGGFTTVVTKSGTNQIHGEAFEYYRNTGMTALNQFQQAAAAAQGTGNPPYKRNQWGGDAGGPILKNKLHYYGAYDDTETTGSYTLFVSGTAAVDFTAPGLEGTFPQPSHDRLLTGRVDYDITPHQQAFFRYAQEWYFAAANGCSGASTNYCYDGQIPRWAYVGGHTWEPNPHMVNDARFQYAYISYQLGPYGTPLPKKPTDLINPSYTQNISQGFIFPNFSYGKDYAAVGIETRYELNDTLSIEHHTHQIKMGGDVSYVPYIDSGALNLNGSWSFAANEPFNPANTSNLTNPAPYLFTQSAIPQIYYLPSTQQAYFVGDTWKWKPNVTLNYGLRWERQIGSAFLDHYTPNTTKYETIPFEGNPHTRADKRNFGPRLGFTYDPLKKGRDVIRGGVGIFYNFVETEQSEAEDLNFISCSITLPDSQYPTLNYPNPYQGLTVSSFCSSAAPSVTILAPTLRNPYQFQYSLGYSHQIAADLSVSADGIYTRGLRDYKTYDLNYPLQGGTYAPLEATALYARPYTNCSAGLAGYSLPFGTGPGEGPCFNQINQHQSTGATEYRGLYLKIDKRMSHNYMYSLSYALSASYDNNPHSAPVNYLSQQSDWGPATYDQRHAVVGSFSYLAPFKILVGGIFTFRSSLPYSVTTGTPTCAQPNVAAGQVLPTACNGVVNGGVLPIATNADGTSLYVPGTTRDQGNRGINFAAINTYRSQLTGTSLPGTGPVGSVTSTNVLDFDLRVSKSVIHHEAMDLQVFGQAFNLFGRENFTSITTNPTSGSFGLATAAQTVQPQSNVQVGEIGAKFTF